MPSAPACGRPDRRDRARAAGSPAGRGGIGLRNGASASRADHPRRNAGQEILGEERPQRLIFPRLQVARRPVVEQAIAGDMLARLADRDRRPELVAAADPDAELELVIEAAARAIFGRIGVGRLALPVGPDHRLARRRAPSLPGRDSRSAHICSWAAADCRAGTACRHWSRGECRRRNRCNRRSGTARASALRSVRSAAARHRRDSARREATRTAAAEARAAPPARAPARR